MHTQWNYDREYTTPKEMKVGLKRKSTNKLMTILCSERWVVVLRNDSIHIIIIIIIISKQTLL